MRPSPGHPRHAGLTRGPDRNRPAVTRQKLRGQSGAAADQQRDRNRRPLTLPKLWAVTLAAAMVLAGCSGSSEDNAAQSPDPGCASGEILDFGFYTEYPPVSYRADDNPDSDGFGEHAGYEADLLDALEAMDGAGLQFNRVAVADWSGIWLLPASGEVDIAGGGMTILETRTRDADGNTAVAFTAGHIEFRNVLLVRAADTVRYQSFDNLTSDTTIGAVVDTTGEQRLLELTGLAAPDGTLAAGTTIETPTGTVTADGTDAFVVTAAGASENLRDRIHLLPPTPNHPMVRYFDDDTTQYEALASGEIDAVSRDNVGAFEQAASYGGGGVLAVGALDEAVDLGGWTVRAADNELRECLDDKLAYLTDDLRIGFPQWSADNEVFMRRALAWTP